MQKHYFYAIVGLLVGVAIGFIGANSINRRAATGDAAAAAGTLAAQNAPSMDPAANNGGMVPDVADALAKAENDPQNFPAQMRAGDMYARIGRFDKAVEFYKKGLALKPNDFRANVVLANALFDSRQFEAAADHYSKALELKPADSNARTDLGTTFIERQNPDPDRAIKEFEKVLETEPKHEPALFNLSMAYFRKGDKDTARKTLQRLEAANPSSELIPRLRQNLSTPQ